MTDFQQFLAPDSDFTRRAAVSAQAKQENLEMGSVDDDISAMFESSHGNVSLAGVMAPVTSPDIFASFASHSSHHQGMSGLARASTMSQAALASHTSHLSNASFSAAFDAFMPTFPAPTPAPPTSNGGLHRYHSAPGAFLQALAEDAFSQIPSIGANPPPGSLFSEGGLAPITELDVERSGSGNSMTEFEQFLSPDSDFSRRAAMSAQTKPENSEMFANLFPPTKNTGLLRQKSLPVPPPITIVPKQDPMEEHQSDGSISGTSDDHTLGNGLKASMYDDLFTTWPTSPGAPGGKRARGFAGESETSSGTSKNPKSFRLNNHSGLIRHASLPTSAGAAAAAAAAAAATAINDDHYVQMRARAKRGCATHPRSIAERVRRTRISERMKKLQDLVPNMERTTNTSDMLDETVDYVKSLQLKVSELNATIAQLKASTMTPAQSSS